MAFTKHITIEEAKSMGVYNRHTFAPCEITFPGEGIYFLKFHDGIKIGMAKNLRRRLDQYNKPWIKPVLEVKCYRTKQAAALEHLFKQEFSHAIYTKDRSYEFLVGHSFEHVIGKVEKSPFFHKAFNQRYST